MRLGNAFKVLLLAAAIAAPHAASAAGELQCAQTKWEPLWTDRGSGASRDVSFFRPSTGFNLGDHVQGGGAPNGDACGFSTTDPTALAPATGYVRVYSDVGTGAKQDGSIWAPNCPAGYRALGWINVIGHSMPPNAEQAVRFRCVRANLVREVQRPYLDIWNDRKSGGKQDVSVWGYNAYASQYHGNAAHNYFVAEGKYNPPATPTLALVDGAVTLAKPGQVTAATIDQWMKTFAPVVRFHPQEKYFPTNIEAFIANTVPAGDGLALRDTSDAGKAGNVGAARVYVNAKVGPDSTELQYWFLYAYNGAGTAYFKYLKVFTYDAIGDYSMTPCGQHEGDWEHITVRVDNRTGQLAAVYLSQHDAGVWYPASQVPLPGGRVTFYASKNGHAAYWAPGRNYSNEIAGAPKPIEFRLVNATDNGGQAFDSRINGGGPQLIGKQFVGGLVTPAVVVPELLPAWRSINGRWGRHLVRGVTAARNELEKTFGSVGGALINLGVIQFVDYVMEKTGLKGECSEEIGPQPPWMKGSWKGPDT